MELYLTITSKRWKLQPEELIRFLRRAASLSQMKGGASILITGSGRVRLLNRRFRGKDVATDVISFPAVEVSGFAGDIAISAEIAGRSARQLGHSLQDEVKVLLLHGLLHLAGHDHESDSGEMRRKENELRRRLGLPVTLIARAERPRHGRHATTSKKPTSDRKPAKSGRGNVKASR